MLDGGAGLGGSEVGLGCCSRWCGDGIVGSWLWDRV